MYTPSVHRTLGLGALSDPVVKKLDSPCGSPYWRLREICSLATNFVRIIFQRPGLTILPHLAHRSPGHAEERGHRLPISQGVNADFMKSRTKCVVRISELGIHSW